jgi:hypothetical protein
MCTSLACNTSHQFVQWCVAHAGVWCTVVVQRYAAGMGRVGTSGASTSCHIAHTRLRQICPFSRPGHDPDQGLLGCMQRFMQHGGVRTGLTCVLTCGTSVTISHSRCEPGHCLRPGSTPHCLCCLLRSCWLCITWSACFTLRHSGMLLGDARISHTDCGYACQC